ncbi:MAG: hypothetical protein JO235_07655 [Chroococcidiopsidaceae cyanobacterium CP_BM_RX_35]|nr:hypothetical protein [Chroococcidiopsidaceae cyanobacterium CP_BM_RX_35]
MDHGSLAANLDDELYSGPMLEFQEFLLDLLEGCLVIAFVGQYLLQLVLRNGTLLK